eukprot:TRINITY_DN2792_c0_g1_i1.p1 TRINITY_DN2792_c0_g1~~TRINITY_DN2792_c0_g1_i1.p1  ORF type:complete len:169 (-),score=25.24 TRINITY_DN2792_c0_g1_i1:5-511(-)
MQRNINVYELNSNKKNIIPITQNTTVRDVLSKFCDNVDEYALCFYNSKSPLRQDKKLYLLENDDFSYRKLFIRIDVILRSNNNEIKNIKLDPYSTVEDTILSLQEQYIPVPDHRVSNGVKQKKYDLGLISINDFNSGKLSGLSLEPRRTLYSYYISPKVINRRYIYNK